MNRNMKNSMALIAMLLATTASLAQVPVLTKPVLAPQANQKIKPIVLKNPITVVSPLIIARDSPDRAEAARRLKAQNIPVASALAALRSAFGRLDGDEARTLRAAGYSAIELAATFKQVDQLSASRMLPLMPLMGFNESELAPQLKQLYALDFDGLLVILRQETPHRPGSEFPHALAAMDYSVAEMVKAGYRYFSGGFGDPVVPGTSYPNARQLYASLMLENPLREQVKIDHYALFQLLIASGYAPEQVIAGVPMGRYSPVTIQPMDEVSRCIAPTTSNAGQLPGQRVDERFNPQLVIQMAPNGSATHADARRVCVAKFLGLLRENGTGRDVARVLADLSVKCMPQTNPACPGERGLEIDRLLKGAGYAL
ncbi:MAG: hypothetical protein ABI858_07430 [Pseudoxanthomonas sp.]